jgi:tRNA pseudouridine38-40 synthase
MVGTLAEVAEGHIPADSIPARLDSLNRQSFGRTAPAEGLYLNRVFYNDPEKEGYHAEKESH